MRFFRRVPGQSVPHHRGGRDGRAAHHHRAEVGRAELAGEGGRTSCSAGG